MTVVKKSSLSPIPHPIYSNPTINNLRPHIFYSNRDGDFMPAESGGITWTERSSDFHVSNLVQGIKKYYVRRADGQPVRLKNKVKVDVDGNLDVTGTFDLSDSNFTNAGNIQLDSISGDADTNTSITFSGSDVITVATGGTTSFTVDASQNILMNAAQKVQFRDTALTIHSSTDGQLDINADTELEITAPTVDINASSGVDISANLTVGGSTTLGATSFGDADITNVGSIALDTITNDGTDITLDSSNDIVIDAEGGNIEFKDAGTLQLTLDMDGTAGAQVIKLGVDSDDLIFQQFDGNEVIRIADDRALYFFDKGGEKISSDGTDLTINSGADINLTATTDINVPANVGITFGNDAEKIEGDGTDLTISGNNINLTAVADVNIPSGVGLTFATAEKIESDGTDLSVTVGSGGDINIPANIGVTFGDDGEKIEGDGTDLTISGNNINLTATADVVVPANVGVTFGSGEKIEGDDTDLTITSGAKINLTATSDIHVPNNVGIVFGGDSEKIEGDGTDLTISANNLTVDAAADINLDADGADVNIKDGGTTILSFTNSSSDAVITAGVQDKDIIFKGDDGGSAITSLTLDMSNSGAAAFSAAAYNAEATLTDASTISWNAITQPVAKVTLGANRTLGAASGGIAGAFISLLIIQDGTGSRTVTFNAAYEFKDDTAPTLTTTASKGDLFVFRYNGSKWLEVGRNLNLTLS